MISIKCFLLFGLVLVHGIEATKGKGGGYGREYGGDYAGGGYGGGHSGGGHSPAQQHIIIVPAPQPVFYHVPASIPVHVPSYSAGGYGGGRHGGSHGYSTAGHKDRQIENGGSYAGHGFGQSGDYGTHTVGAPVHVHVHASAPTPTYQPASATHYQSAPVVPSYQHVPRAPSYHPAPAASYGGGYDSRYGGGHSGGYGVSAASAYVPAPITTPYHPASAPSYGSSHAVGGY